MKTMLLHHSVVGKTRDLSHRFSYPSKHFKNYRGESDYIILVGGHFYKEEDAFLLKSFIKTYRKRVIGVIIYDDKNYGKEFGATAKFYSDNEIEVLGLWDLIVTDEKIKHMEGLINEKVR